LDDSKLNSVKKQAVVNNFLIK